MKPGLRDMAVDKILTQFSVAYRNENLISDLIFPVIKVKERAGKFAKYGKDNLRLETSIERAPGARARSFDYSVSQGSYACSEKSLEKIVPDEFAENTDDPYDAKRDAVLFAIDKIWLHQEAALADYMASTANLTQNVTLAGADQWSDGVNSDPLGDITTARETIKLNTAKHPNVAVFGYQTWKDLIRHPDVIERIKYIGLTDPNMLQKAVADLLEVSEIYIGDAVKNTANQGQADSMSYVWGKHFWLLYKAPRPTLMQASFGYTIKDMDRQVDTYREEARVGDVVRVRDSYDQTVVDSALAYFVKNAVA